jgi:hypothetical protein
VVGGKGRGYVRIEKEVVRRTSDDPVNGVAKTVGGLRDVLCKVMVRE